MEKRTILAFALSFLILILWSAFFAPKSQKAPPPAPEQAGAPSARAPEIVPGAPPGGSTTAAEQPSAPLSETMAGAQDVVVETPLYRAVLSNAGPSFRSFRLKNYRETATPDSPFIELVNMGSGQQPPVAVAFQNPDSPAADTPIYQTDATDITLSPDSSPAEISFRQVTATGLTVTQTFRFYPGQYRIDLDVRVMNGAANPFNGAFTADLRALPPEKKKSYYAYVGLLTLVNGDLEKIKLKNPGEEKALPGALEWLAYEDDYFITALVMEEPAEGTLIGRKLNSGLLHARYLPSTVTLNAQEEISARFALFLGPRDLDALKAFGGSLERAVNFGWTDIIAKPLLHTLRFIYRYIPNYGVCIILLTVLIKIVFWPLTHKSYKSMKEMKKLQPRLAKLREKYKGNREQMNREMMALYRTYKVNPMGGCLPMVVQIPVFFALFRILGASIELRHAPFILWIQDLSAPDRLFHFPFTLPFMAQPQGIPVLTLLMGASMFIQQKMTPTPGDPAQAKMMMMLPIVFTFMFINFPSGLVLYWLVNNLLSIGQQYRVQQAA